MTDLVVGAVIGFVSGIASGAFGIGGALLSTPGIRWFLDAPAKIAVGTTLPVIIPSAITGLIAYQRGGFLDLRNAGVAATAGCAFAVVGALATEAVEGELLLVITAAVILFLSIRMFPRHSDGTRRTVPRTVPVFLVVGAFSGFLSGLLGLGGGVVLVPALTVLLGFPVKTALGTSLAVVASQAIPGSVTHALIGNIDWTIAAGLAIGVIPGARIGSKLAVGAEDRRLRIVVSVVMAALAVVFGVGELRALLA